jgi:hypothetical protein
MATYHDMLALYSMSALLQMLLSLSAVPVLAALTEALPVRIRAGSVSVIYAFSVAIFGGSAQAIVKWLIDATNALAPAYYMTAAYSVAIIAMALMRETAPAKVRR